MKTERDLICIYLERHIDDVKLIEELTDVMKGMGLKEFAAKYPKLLELKQKIIMWGNGEL